MNDETLIPAKLVDYLSNIPDAEEPDGLERALTATRQERRAFDMEDDLVNSTHSSSPATFRKCTVTCRRSFRRPNLPLPQLGIQQFVEFSTLVMRNMSHPFIVRNNAYYILARWTS